MRVGSTVLLSEQRCVQSYEWSLKRPLGSLQGVLDSLEEYHCDEVAIIRPVRANDSLKCFQQDIKVVQQLTTMTPISFGGGIRTIEHLNLLQDLPIERLVFSSLFLDNEEALISKAKDLFGHQAIQCLLPMMMREGEAYVYHSEHNVYIPFSSIDCAFISELANEIILFDIKHEGQNDCFDWLLLDSTPFTTKKIIISGGIGHQDIKKAAFKNVASVLIDNKILHQEYSILGYKHATNLS